MPSCQLAISGRNSAPSRRTCQLLTRACFFFRFSMAPLATRDPRPTCPNRCFGASEARAALRMRSVGDRGQGRSGGDRARICACEETWRAKRTCGDLCTVGPLQVSCSRHAALGLQPQCLRQMYVCGYPFKLWLAGLLLGPLPSLQWLACSVLITGDHGFNFLGVACSLKPLRALGALRRAPSSPMVPSHLPAHIRHV